MSNDWQTHSGWGITNGIRADSHDFMGVYRSVKKNMIAYGSGTWVHMNDAWVLWEGHDMVFMLLTERTVCVYQHWTYKRG
jgi:hypothetical protein